MSVSALLLRRDWLGLYLSGFSSTKNLYYFVFLSRYYKFLLEYLSLEQIMILHQGYEKYLNSELSNKALLDTLLLDTLIFAKAYENDQILKIILVRWKETIVHPHLFDLSKRATENEIALRVELAINLLLDIRKLMKNDVLQYKHFFTSYYIIRQIFDDIGDYQDDIHNGIKTYVRKVGKVKARDTIMKHHLNIKRLQIPLYYKRLSDLYCQYYLK